MTRTGTATFSKCGGSGRWSFLTIALMVLGFIVWWPLGLAVLAYNIWGDRMELEKHWNNLKDEFSARTDRHGPFSATGNQAFDDYRREELKRLEEEHRRLKEEEREFAEFMRDLRRARDKDEFDQFMKSRRNSG